MPLPTNRPSDGRSGDGERFYHPEGEKGNADGSRRTTDDSLREMGNSSGSPGRDAAGKIDTGDPSQNKFAEVERQQKADRGLVPDGKGGWLKAPEGASESGEAGALGDVAQGLAQGAQSGGLHGAALGAAAGAAGINPSKFSGEIPNEGTAAALPGAAAAQEALGGGIPGAGAAKAMGIGAEPEEAEEPDLADEALKDSIKGAKFVSQLTGRLFDPTTWISLAVIVVLFAAYVAFTTTNQVVGQNPNACALGTSCGALCNVGSEEVGGSTDNTASPIDSHSSLAEGKAVATGLHSAGFGGDDLIEMTAIAYAENGWNNATGDNSGAGSTDLANYDQTYKDWSDGLPGGGKPYPGPDPTPGDADPAPDLIALGTSGVVKYPPAENGKYYWGVVGPFEPWNDFRPGANREPNSANIPQDDGTNALTPAAPSDYPAITQEGNLDYEEALATVNKYIAQWVPDWTSKKTSTGSGSTSDALAEENNTSNCNNDVSIGGGSMAQVATTLAWPAGPGGTENTKAATNAPNSASCPGGGDSFIPLCGIAQSTPQYIAATKQYDSVGSYGQPYDKAMYASCDHFVATVARAAGADPDYPLYGAGVNSTQGVYLSSHPKIWKQVTSGNIPPGAIMEGVDIEHTWIAVSGDPTNEIGAQASNDDHSGTMMNEGGYSISGGDYVFTGYGTFQAWVPVQASGSPLATTTTTSTSTTTTKS